MTTNHTPTQFRKSPCPRCGKLVSWNNSGKAAHARKCNPTHDKPVSAATADAMHATITGYMRRDEALTARVAELEAALRDLEYAVSGNHALRGLMFFQKAQVAARDALAKGQA